MDRQISDKHNVVGTGRVLRRKINAAFESETVGGRAGNPDYFERYPVARTLPPQTTLLRVLEIDDAAAFER